METSSMSSDLRVISTTAVEALKQEAIVGVLRRDVVEYSKLMELLKTPVSPCHAVSDTQAHQEFNDAINHAIKLGSEGIAFLQYWREGDWDACAKYGFISPQANKANVQQEQVSCSAQNSLDIILEAGRLIRENNRGKNLTDAEEDVVQKAIAIFGYKKWPGYYDDDDGDED